MDAPLLAPEVRQDVPGAFHAAHGSVPLDSERAPGSEVEREAGAELLVLGEAEIPHARKVMHSSGDMTWPTPQYVFDALNLEFGFTLDPCCVPATAKCAKYYTPKEDGLKQDWSGERAFMNPPYGAEMPRWIKKAYEESRRGALVVCLVPARVDTNWWHDYAIRGEVRFLKGRVRGSNGQSWPFPAAVVIFRPFAYRVKYHDLFSSGAGVGEQDADGTAREGQNDQSGATAP